MKFYVKKEDLLNGIRIVERATSIRSLQPVFFNILIETIDKTTIKLTATDLDLTVSAIVEAQVEEEGTITLDSKSLNDLVSKQANKQILFEMEKDETLVNITCDKSKYEINGISANEFPKEMYQISDNAETIEIELEPFSKAIKYGGFAAATYESNGVLSGIACTITEQMIEVASTDGNRLAKKVEKITNKEKVTKQLVIPSKTLNEFIKMINYIDEDVIKIITEKSKVILKSEKITMISKIMDVQYPKYNQLIPAETLKTVVVDVQQLVNAIDRVSVMSDEKNIVKMNFEDNQLILSCQSLKGKSEEKVVIDYTSEPLLIAFNYKYWLDVLKNTESKEIKIGLNTGLSTTKITPKEKEDYVCLIMPMQIR